MSEALNKAQEQQLYALLDAIMQDNIVLRRSFGGDIPNSYVLTKCVNRVVEERPELKEAAVLMILYPALKWMMQAQDLDVMMQNCENVHDDEMCDVEAISPSAPYSELAGSEHLGRVFAFQETQRILRKLSDAS